MMRALAGIPLLLAAACGGEAEKQEAAPKANRIAEGQWELASEVTASDSLDAGTPRIAAAAGDRATASVCVGAGERPPAELFAGEGYDCRYGNYYARNGRLNITLDCRRDDLAGMVGMSIDGSFGESEIAYGRTIETNLSTDGDVRIAVQVTGRRTGDCPAEAEDEAE